jgi:Transposase, Mutator family
VKGSINTSKEHTVAATKMELAELLSKADGADADWLREGVRVLAQALMDAEVSAQIGATHGQRTPDRLTHRNGYRPREWDTRVGTIELAIPRLRSGSYLPSWLEPRRCVERALCAVVAQCYVGGCRPGGSTTSPARWASMGSPSRRCCGWGSSSALVLAHIILRQANSVVYWAAA